MSARILTAACAALLFLSTAHAADQPIFKWKDAQGKVHYGPEPQPGTQAQKIQVREHAPRQDQNKAPTDQPEQEQADQTPADDTELTVDEKRCQVAKENLRKYQGADFLYTTDSNGKQRVLSDAEKKQTIEDAKAAMDQACNPQEGG